MVDRGAVTRSFVRRVDSLAVEVMDRMVRRIGMVRRIEMAP